MSNVDSRVLPVTNYLEYEQRKQKTNLTIAHERNSREDLMGIPIDTPAEEVYTRLGFNPETVEPLYVIGGAYFSLPSENRYRLAEALSSSLAQIARYINQEDRTRLPIVLNCGTGMVMEYSAQARTKARELGVDVPVIGVGAESRIFHKNNQLPKSLPDYLQGKGTHAHPTDAVTHFVSVTKPNNPDQQEWWGTTELLVNMSGKFALLANGGPGTLEEIIEVLKHQKQLIIIQGSGRIADQIIKIVRDPHNDEEFLIDGKHNTYCDDFKAYTDTNPEWINQVQIIDTHDLTDGPEEIAERIVTAIKKVL